MTGNHQLLSILGDRISGGLKRKTITSCSKWAEQYRIMGQPFPGKWSFEHHPWTRLMHDAPEEMIVGQKAAQMGYTEAALNKVFYSIDVEGKSCLYILPASNPDASDFSTSRFDPALEMSDHLANMFSDVKNIGHKRAGNANLFIRGSRSRSQLKSLPIGFIVCDELDEMNQDNVSLAFERMSGQVDKQSFLISTPTIDKYGINNFYEVSTQDHYFFPCPHCNRRTELTFPECLVITADDANDPKIRDTHIICKECNVKLEHAAKVDYLNKGDWVSSRTDRLARGFYVNQLYSMTVKPYELAALYLKAQTNPSDEQEFYNSKLGLTHVVEGAKVSDKNLHECTGSHKKQLQATPNALITMGIDVGTYLHYEVDQWFLANEGSDINLMYKCRVLAEGKVQHFEELDLLFRDFNVRFAVIDANPERRKALEFAQRHYGRVKLCFYGTGITGKSISVHAPEEHTITVDRTSWLDLSLSRFRRQEIILPVDLSMEYKSHIKALVRIYDKDVNGNPVGKYVKGNEDDHLAHARNYAEIALPLGASLAQSHNIGSVV
jgi:hypothetical protein